MSLLLSKTAAEFLKEWISSNYPKSSFEALAKKCGMSSKSSMHDILSGRRKASLESLIGICNGLKITGPEKKLLHSLWSEKEITELEKLRKQVTLKSSKKKSKSVPIMDCWDYVYSSLGSLEQGTPLHQIATMAKITEDQCKKVLDNLISLDLASLDQKTEKYTAKALHSLFEEDSFNEKKYLIGKASKLKKSISDQYGKRDQALYRNLIFSIPPQSFPKLREKLKTLLDEFADEVESQSGTELMEVFIAIEQK